MPERSDEAIVEEKLQRFAHMRIRRANHDLMNEEIASLIWPEYRTTFFYPSEKWPGMKLTQFQIDSTGMIMLWRFVAVCSSYLSPQGLFHNLAPSDSSLKRKSRVREYFGNVENVLFPRRTAHLANFADQMNQNYGNLGAFGSQTMFIDGLVDAGGRPLPGWRYRACPKGEIYLGENHQGLVNEVIRWFKLTARQAAEQWGEDNMPEPLQPDLKSGSEVLHNFLHCVGPQVDYDPKRRDRLGMPFASYYISIDGRKLMQKGGYTSFPYAVGRWSRAPGEVEGRGPAAFVLPTLKTLNNQKAAVLEAAHLALRPPLLVGDDGLVDTFDRTAGGVNKGGVTPEGKPLVLPLAPGNVQVGVETMQMDTEIIKDAFLVSLFQLLYDTAKMSATEVVERVRQIAIFLVPALEPQNAQYLGPIVEREIDIAAHQGLLPPMPPELVEARGEYTVEFTSPIALMARMPQVAGILRTLEAGRDFVNVTQDPSIFDPLNLSNAIRLIADINAVPSRVQATVAEERAKARARAQAAERQQQMREMPAMAAMVKARAVQAKAGAGQNIGGTLSGVPQGEMPMVPGQGA